MNLSLPVILLVALAAPSASDAPQREEKRDWECADEASGPVRRRCRLSRSVAVGHTIEVLSPQFERPLLDRPELVEVVPTATGLQLSGRSKGTTSIVARTRDAQYELQLTVTDPVPPRELMSKGWACERNSTKLGVRGNFKPPWICRRAVGLKVDEGKSLDLPRYHQGVVAAPNVVAVRFRSGYLTLSGMEPGTTQVLLWTEDAVLELSVTVEARNPR